MLSSQQLVNQTIPCTTPLLSNGDSKTAIAAAAVAATTNGLNGNVANGTTNGSTGVSPAATPTARYPHQAMPPTGFMQPSAHMYTNLQHSMDPYG